MRKEKESESSGERLKYCWKRQQVPAKQRASAFPRPPRGPDFGRAPTLRTARGFSPLIFQPPQAPFAYMDTGPCKMDTDIG